MFTKERYNCSILSSSDPYNLDIDRTICQKERWWIHVIFLRAGERVEHSRSRLFELYLPLHDSQVMNFSFERKSFHLLVRGCARAKWNEKHSSTIPRNIGPPLLPREREEESAMLSRNVTRSTSPRFGIFMRRFVYWISLLVYRVKLEIGIREGMGSGRVSSQDYWSVIGSKRLLVFVNWTCILNLWIMYYFEEIVWEWYSIFNY